ncbi:unnamed protein product [Amaranthus hypochondriacus]
MSVNNGSRRQQIRTTHFSIFCSLILFISVVCATHDEVGPLFSAAESCEQTYGFLPCTTTVLGNCFLIIVYGYLMYMGATYLSNGSELLLEILGPGIVGGLFLPILGALPDSMLILVSGLFGSTAIAQEQVSVGMGLLAGSTVMLLTIIWGTCVLIGKCDLESSRAVDEIDTKGLSLVGSGVSIDIWTSYAARIMAISVVPFLVVQLPQALDSSSGRHLVVFIALIISLLMLISYCVYQIFQPWIQERKLEYVKHKRVVTRFLKHLKKHALGRLFTQDGTPNTDVLSKIFREIDLDGDGQLSEEEFAAFIVGMQLEGIGMGTNDIVQKLMKELDRERPNQQIDLDEFTEGISKLLHVLTGDKTSRHADTIKPLEKYDEEAEIEHFLLGDSNQEAGEEIKNPKAITIKAITFLVLGTVIAAVFADPLVDAVDNFSNATSIPSFFISFIALPLATNSSEAVSAIIFASRKKRRSASLTFSEVHFFYCLVLRYQCDWLRRH